MRGGTSKGGAVVVPSQIVAQRLDGLNLRDPF
jgi:hypothetical protein